MVRFREVLKNRDFFFLWLGQIISQIGDRLGQMALIGLVYMQSPGSSIELAKILSFTILPVFLIGPVAGVYVDRWDRRRTMFLCDFLRTAMVLFIPLIIILRGPFSLIYLLIFLVFSVGRFFIPAKLSIVPDLVDREHLVMANSLINTTAMIAAFFGFGIGGLVVEWFKAIGGFCLDALSFFISGALIFFISKPKVPYPRIKQVGREIVEVIRKSVIQEIKEGIIYFIKQKDIRFTGLILFLLGGALGAVYVVMIIFIQQVLGSATRDLGLLAMFLGLGLFFGSLVYGRYGARLSQLKVIFPSLVASGLILIVFVISLSCYPYLLIALALSFILGGTISPIIISCNTLIHNSSQNEMMGRVFSSLEFLMHLAFVLFMFVSGILAEFIAPNLILMVVACSFILLGGVSFFFSRKIPWLS